MYISHGPEVYIIHSDGSRVSNLTCVCVCVMKLLGSLLKSINAISDIHKIKYINITKGYQLNWSSVNKIFLKTNF